MGHHEVSLSDTRGLLWTPACKPSLKTPPHGSGTGRHGLKQRTPILDFSFCPQHFRAGDFGLKQTSEQRSGRRGARGDGLKRERGDSTGFRPMPTGELLSGTHTHTLKHKQTHSQTHSNTNIHTHTLTQVIASLHGPLLWTRKRCCSGKTQALRSRFDKGSVAWFQRPHALRRAPPAGRALHSHTGRPRLPSLLCAEWGRAAKRRRGLSSNHV